ncbi:MAG: TetR/AcrR family transcriptional regulator [Crocinitomicaceae bacterium]
MSKTRDKIFSTSLRLFNDLGMSNVTLRAIAVEMNISQGNLNYHFKKRDDIIEGLYFQLVSEINETMSNLEKGKNGLGSLFIIIESIMNKLYDYRFFMLGFSDIVNGNEVIRIFHKDLNVLRQQQVNDIFKVMISKGLMKPESLENEYSNLYKRTQILVDFWIASAQIELNEVSKDSIPKYMNLISQSIYPYLTEKGKIEFEQFV